MRAVVQRVTWARVTVAGEEVAAIGAGLLALVAVGRADTEADRLYVAEKLLHLRVFADEHGRLNRSLRDVAGELLVVSQFTLYGDVRRGRRPSFTEAAPPDRGRAGYEAFIQMLHELDVPVVTGIFQADMQVSLCNDGPVTVLIDSQRLF